MPHVPSLDAILIVIRAFVLRTRGTPDADITANTRLLQEGHVDSFGLIDLITELEGQLGLDLPQGSLIPEDFETPQILHERLVALAG
jgi:acyl carrier protein